MAVNKEKCIVVNSDNEIIDYKDRDDLNSQEDRWRISAVFLFNSKRQVLLAKRHPSKKVDPGLWGPTAAGTLEVGETEEENAYKELGEEVGVSNVELEFKGIFRTDRENYNRFIYVYTGFKDVAIEDIKIEEDEVAAVKWFDLKDLEAALVADADQFVPDVYMLLNAMGIFGPDKGDEFIHITDENDQLLFFEERGLATNRTLRVSVAWIEDQDNNVLIHKRSMKKDAGPGRWENAAGGVVASYETPAENAYRELQEEIGVTDVDLEFVDKTIVHTSHGDRMCYWYKGVLDRNEWPEERFVLEEGAVDEVKWISKKELLTLRDKNPDQYMPSSAYWQELFS